MWWLFFLLCCYSLPVKNSKVSDLPQSRVIESCKTAGGNLKEQTQKQVCTWLVWSTQTWFCLYRSVPAHSQMLTCWLSCAFTNLLSETKLPREPCYAVGGRAKRENDMEARLGDEIIKTSERLRTILGSHRWHDFQQPQNKSKSYVSSERVHHMCVYSLPYLDYSMIWLKWVISSKAPTLTGLYDFPSWHRAQWNQILV